MISRYDSRIITAVIGVRHIQTKSSAVRNGNLSYTGWHFAQVTKKLPQNNEE
jgi:hypothetical protein